MFPIYVRVQERNYSSVLFLGSSPSGEYFNPGNDCTDILNSNVAAKDGYYWINLNKGVPKKVCNMFSLVMKPT